MSSNSEKEDVDGTAVRDHASEIALLGETSPGVRRMEILNKYFTLSDRIFLFVGIFLVAYAYGLDGLLRIVYTPYATGSFLNHSLLSTVNVLRAVIAAAAQPTAAKLSDVFGRAELVMVSVVFYMIGTIIDAASDDVQTYSAGAIFYQIGYTIIILMVEVIIADVTSLRSRLLFSYIPAAPFIINTWVSGDVSAAVLKATSWRWGIGMWAIIYPLCTIPLIFALFNAHRRAKKSAALSTYKTPYQTVGAGRLAGALFWQLDIIGIFLLIAVFALILVPFTIAGGTETQWQEAKVIAPLVIGLLCVPVWVVWEMKCKHPMIPFKLLKDRGVWGALGIATWLNFAWYLQGDFLYTVLSVSFNESILSATRITSLYSFVSVLTGLFVGLVVFYVRRLKIFVVFGTTLFLVAFGVLIYYRGGSDGASHSGIIGAEILLGIAGGMFPYTAQASIQAATKHEHVAVVTGLYLACYNIGSALGNTVSGAIWSQVLPGKLEDYLGDPKLAAKVYGDPLVQAIKFPIGSPERDAITSAYRDTQRLLCICGICLCVPLIAFSCVMRNPKLGKEQSLTDAEKEDVVEERGTGVWAWLKR